MFGRSVLRLQKGTHMTESGETFTQFKDSFLYGTRPDLNFKFLKNLTEEEAAVFLQQLLHKVGNLLDSGDATEIINHVRDGQRHGYRNPTQWAYEDKPFVPLNKPLPEATIGLMTSTGHFVDGEDPEPFGVEAMSQDEAVSRISDFLRVAPDLSRIPTDITPEALRVRHGGYDIRGSLADRNVALALDRMNELAAEGEIGRFANPAYSFVGAAAQTRLKNKTLPEWVQVFQEAQLDGLILVPV